MEFIYQTVHFNGSEDLEQFTRKKMNSIFTKLPDLVQAVVTLSMDGVKQVEGQVCEIKLEVPGRTVVVKKNAATFEQSVRLAIQAVQKIIRRQKRISGRQE